MEPLEKEALVADEEAKAVMVGLLNERSEAAQALEKVLMSLSSDPEMKAAQEEHEAEKAELLRKSMALQEELRTSEGAEQAQRHAFDDQVEGVVQTARNLGQMAAYFLQTNQVEEAADFYLQAKSMFEGLLGANHPKTLQWQEDLFFLINAPVIQQMVKQAQDEHKGAAINPSANIDRGKDEHLWWLQNLFEMGNHDKPEGSDKDEDILDNWWMQNLFAMDEVASNKPATAAGSDDDNADFMQVLFGTPRGDGKTTPRGGPAFTPRGTLVALSEVNGNKGAAISLGKPLQKQSGIPEDQQVDDAETAYHQER